MYQVLVRIPLGFTELPVYGFGTMLVVALVLGVLIASRRAEKEGIAGEVLQDLAFWIVVAGIIGARLVFMVQYWDQFHNPLIEFFYFWQGGLVFYGSLLGGVVGYLLGYYFLLAKHAISGLKLADIIAPSAALGIALGRVGCLLNGCCYGHVAAPNCPAIHFPYRSFPWTELVKRGDQTSAGFVMDAASTDGRKVAAVEPASAAARAGLQANDVIVAVNHRPVANYHELEDAFLADDWPRGKTDVQLTVLRDGKSHELPAFTAWGIGLHPTQLYETVSMLLLFGLLLAYYPLRRRDGEVFALFLTCYPVHRFFNEILRNDTKAVALDMTLSMNGSILVLAAGLALWVWLLRRPVQYHPFEARQRRSEPEA